jgi:hypothetical protein
MFYFFVCAWTTELGLGEGQQIQLFCKLDLVLKKCLCFVVFFTFRNACWASGLFAIKGISWSQRRDCCFRCFLFWLSHPGISFETICQLVQNDPPKGKHRKELDAIDPSKYNLNALKDAEVSLEHELGCLVKAPYDMYSPKEFLEEFGTDHTKIQTQKKLQGLKLTTVRNEQGKKEDVVLVRNGPRKLEIVGFCLVRQKEAIMEYLVRPGQAEETFAWASNKEKKSELAFHMKRSKIPTRGAILLKLKERCAMLKKSEGCLGETLDDDGESGVETRAMGLQMPLRGGGSLDPKPKGKGSGKQKPEDRDGSLRCKRPNKNSFDSATENGDWRPESESGNQSLGTESYFNFQSVLAGDKKGAALQGARRHMQTLGGQTKAIDKLEKEITCFLICQRLAPSVINGESLAELQKMVKDARTLCKLEMPLHVQLTLCSKFAEALVKGERWGEFAKAMRVWRMPDDPKFSEASPYYSALITKCDHTLQKQLVFARQILESFFSNSACDLFKEPLDRGLHSLPCDMAVAFCQEFASAGDEQLMQIPDTLTKCMDIMLTGSRAIVAVSSPVPGLCSSKIDDVRRVLTPLDIEAVGEDQEGELPTTGYDDLRTAAMKNPSWKARILSYATLALEDNAIAPLYEEVLSQLSVDNISLDVVQGSIDKCHKWTQVLRTGGCSAIFEKLSAWVHSAGKSIDEDPTNLEVPRMIIKVLTLIDPRGSDKDLLLLKKKSTVKISAGEGTESQAGLAALIAIPDNAISIGDGKFQQALDRCKGLFFGGVLHSQLADFAGLMQEHLVKIVSESTQRPANWKQHFEAAHLAMTTLVDFPGMSDLQTVSREQWGFLRQLLSEAVEFKSAVGSMSVEGIDGLELQDAVAAVLAAREVLQKKTELDFSTLANHARTMAIHTKEFLESKSDSIQAKLTEARLCLKKDLAKNKGRLDRVAGGTDSGALWKENLTGLEAIGAPVMIKALELLQTAYIDAMGKRTVAVKQVRSLHTMPLLGVSLYWRSCVKHSTHFDGLWRCFDKQLAPAPTHNHNNKPQ